MKNFFNKVISWKAKYFLRKKGNSRPSRFKLNFLKTDALKKLGLFRKGEIKLGTISDKCYRFCHKNFCFETHFPQNSYTKICLLISGLQYQK